MNTTVRKTIAIGDTVTLELPWSEVIMHLGLADKIRPVQVLAGGAQVLNDDGTAYSFPVLWSETGIYTDREGRPYADVLITPRDLFHIQPVTEVQALQSTASGVDWEPVASPTEGTAEHPVQHPYGDWRECTTGEATHVVIAYTVWSDYSGSTVERSNERSLLADYPQTFIRVYGGHGTSGLMLPVDRPADWFADDEDHGAERWQGLLDDLHKLADYPVYDDEDHSALETELADEAWDAYLRDDVIRDLDRAGVPWEAIDTDRLREQFYKITYEADYGPEAESAVSVVFPFYDATIATMAREMGGRS